MFLLQDKFNGGHLNLMSVCIEILQKSQPCQPRYFVYKHDAK